jgi:hypothetical protein
MGLPDFLSLPENCGVTDWQCAYSLAVTCHYTRWKVDLIAYWSPSRRVVCFGGSWYGVPEMPAVSLPTEKEIEVWVRGYPHASRYLRHLAAAKAQRWAACSKTKAIQHVLDERGVSYVVLAWDRQEPKLTIYPCGIASKMNVLRHFISDEVKQLGILFLFVGPLRAANVEFRRAEKHIQHKYRRGIRKSGGCGASGYINDKLQDYNEHFCLYPSNEHAEFLGEISLDSVPSMIQWPHDFHEMIDRDLKLYVDCDANSRSTLESLVFKYCYKCIEGVAIDVLLEYGDIDNQAAKEINDFWNDGWIKSLHKIDRGARWLTEKHYELWHMARDMCAAKLQQYRPKDEILKISDVCGSLGTCSL